MSDNETRPGDQAPDPKISGGLPQAAKSLTGEVAAGVAKKAIAGAAAKTATDTAVSAATGGTTSSAMKALSVGKAVADGRGMEAVDGVISAAAVSAATATTSPLGGAVAQAALNTEVGKKTTRVASWVVILAAVLPIVLVFGMFMAIGSSASMLLVGARSSGVCVDPLGGGLPVTDSQKQMYAYTLTREAYLRGFGREGATIAVMAALTLSQLDPAATNVATASEPSALQPVGIFQMDPWTWSRDSWPAGTSVDSPDFTNPVYLAPAVVGLQNVPTAMAKFYDQFDTDPELRNDKWRQKTPWEVAQQIMKTPVQDGAQFSGEWSSAKSTVATVLSLDPQLKEAAQSDDPGTLLGEDALIDPSTGCGLYGEYAGWGDYALAPGQVGKFTDGPVIYPNTAKALERANRFIGRADLVCSNRTCEGLCDHVAGDIWGYAEASGYYSAKVHWQTALATGVARPGNTTPPIGALLFWDTGEFGHVATYVGNGYVVSNLTHGGPRGPNIYKVAATYFSNNWGAPYLGWADPVFFGQKPGSALK
jgi:hypothetical protein